MTRGSKKILNMSIFLFQHRKRKTYTLICESVLKCGLLVCNCSKKCRLSLIMRLKFRTDEWGATNTVAVGQARLPTGLRIGRLEASLTGAGSHNRPQLFQFTDIPIPIRCLTDRLVWPSHRDKQPPPNL